MKYLRRINESALEDDVREMLLELSDMGYKVNVKEKEEYNLIDEKYWIFKINITLYRPKYNGILIDENLVLNLIRIKLHLNENGYKDGLFNYYDNTPRLKKFYIYDDSRELRNEDAHNWKRWRPVTHMNLNFIKSSDFNPLSTKDYHTYY